MRRSSSKKHEIKGVVFYARVSTDEQAKKQLSIPSQLDELRKFAKAHGYIILREFIEPGASATDDNRKVFKRMMEFVLMAGNNVDAILVLRTDRFMRNATKARAWKESLRRQGIRAISITQETSDDPVGRLIEGIFELLDQYESEINGLRTSAAMRKNAEKGYFNGSHPPYGCKVEHTESEHGIRKGRLVLDPREAEVRREVFRLYVAGSGAKATARDLNQRGYRYRGGRLWRKEHVLRVIGETAAVGVYYWGKVDPITRRPTDREDWVAISVEPGVEQELFDLAQRVREERDPERHPGRAASSPLLLARLLKCGICGASCQLETSGKVGAAGDYYRYYNCRSAVRVGREACKGSRIPVRVLDDAVVRHVADKLFTPDRCRTILADLVEETGVLRRRTAEQRREYQKQIDDINRRIAKWEAAFEEGASAQDLGLDRLRELKAKRDEVAATLGKLTAIRPPPGYLQSDENIERFRSSIRDLFLGEDRAVAKNYLRFLVDRIVVTGKNISIFTRSEAVARLMAEGKKKEVRPEAPVLTSVIDWLPSTDSNRGPSG
jgi:site-specific DNA recombinase